MKTPFAVIAGKGAATDRCGVLFQKLIEVCYNEGEGLPLAATIGVLEMVKLSLIEDAT